MAVESAGILLFHGRGDALRVLLVHPGGPFWRRKDRAAWSIPKGIVAAGETAEATARREFREETGLEPPATLRPLGQIAQGHGKTVIAFAAEGRIDADAVHSNMFEIEWPPHGGARQSFPEIDRAAWFTLAAARLAIIPGQRALLDRLELLIAEP